MCMFVCMYVCMYVCRYVCSKRCSWSSSLEQLVNVPTHGRGHTLDWLTTNRATDILDLTVADMLLSDYFVISFDLLLRIPGRVTKKVTSRYIRSVICMLLGQIFVTFLSLPLSLNQLTPLSVYNTCVRQTLDHHAPLVTRTVTDRMHHKVVRHYFHSS